MINVVINEDKVLALLKQDGRLTAIGLASSLELTQRQVQRILAKMKEKKLFYYGDKQADGACNGLPAGKRSTLKVRNA